MDTAYKLLQEFVTETMQLALLMSGYNYGDLFETRDETVPDTFEFVFGQAVYYYRETHRERFEEIINSYHNLIFHDENTLLEYIRYGIQQITKRDSILMDFLRILAFYADLVIYCQRFEIRNAIVSYIIEYITEIYDYDGVRELFQNRGSYRYLRRVAEEIIGPGVYDVSFLDRVIRYRQQLGQGFPDRRRVNFCLPEDGEKSASTTNPSEAERLASGLEVFANKSVENGLKHKNNISESNGDLYSPSTSGVPPINSTDSDGDSETTSGRKRPEKKSVSEVKKPQSILKSPYGKKGRKRTASDENASDTKKRTRTICFDKSSGKTAIQHKNDPENITQGILIHISDPLSEEQRVSLEKILEEMLNYNKTRTELEIDVYDSYSEYSEASSTAEEMQQTETTDLKFNTNPDCSKAISEVTETSISTLEDLSNDFESSPRESSIKSESKKMDTESYSLEKFESNLKLSVSGKETENTSTTIVNPSTCGKASEFNISPDKPGISNNTNNQIELKEIESVDQEICSEDSKTEISKPVYVVTSANSEFSNLREDSICQIECVTVDIVSDPIVHSENIETSPVLPDESTQVTAKNTYIANPNNSVEIKISPNKSTVKVNQTESKEIGMPSECSESINKLENSSEIMTSNNSDLMSDVRKDIKSGNDVINMDPDNCVILSKDPETGEIDVEDSLKSVPSEHSKCLASVVQNEADRKDTISDSSVNSVKSEIPLEEPKETDTGKVSSPNMDDSIKISLTKSSISKDNPIESNEAKVQVAATESESGVIKSDSSETVISDNDSCKFDVPKDEQGEFSETGMDLDD